MPDLQVGHGRTEFDDGAAELVSQDEWGGDGPGRPAVPAVDVHIGAADPGAPDFYQDLGGAGGGDRNVDQLQAWAGVRLREGQHELIVPQCFSAFPPGWTRWCAGKWHEGWGYPPSWFCRASMAFFAVSRFAPVISR